MATVSFTPNLRRHVDTSRRQVSGSTIADLLENLFEAEPKLKNYVVDDQDRVRKHVNIFIDNEITQDLTTPVHESTEIFIMQALSGG